MNKEERKHKGFVSYFIERPVLINAFLLMVFIGGLFSLMQMNRNQFPDIDMKRVSVITYYFGASPQDVELKVTKVLEDNLQGISGVKRFISTSSSNVSIISVEMETDFKNITKTKSDIRNNMKTAEAMLPVGASQPIITELDPTVIYVASYIISSDFLSEFQLRQAALDAANLLRSVPGVKDVMKTGFRTREYQAFANISKMNQYQATLSDLSTAVTNYNLRSGGGAVNEIGKQRNIVSESLLNGIQDLGNVIVRENFQGENVRVKDVAEVNNGLSTRSRYTRAERMNGVLLQITKKANADVIRTVAQIDDTIKKLIPYLQETIGPQISFIKNYDLTLDIKNMLQITMKNAWEGFILVYVILLLFLDSRTALWAAFNIPVSLLLTFVIIHLGFGFGFDMITLFGMITVLGIVVDQGIVVAENIYQKIEAGFSPKDATIMGTNEIAKAIIAAVGVTIIAFAPLLALGEVVGEFLRPLPIVVIVALLCSTVEVFVSLPTHIMHSAEKKLQKALRSGKPLHLSGESSMGWFSEGYKISLDMMLKHRYITTVVFVLMLIGSVKFMKNIPFIFFSDEQGTVLNLSFQFKSGYTLDQSLEMAKRIEKIVIEEIPYKKELRNLTSQIGIRQDNPMNPSPEETNTISVQALLTPFDERERNIVTINNALIKRIEKDQFLMNNTERMVIAPQASGPPSEGDIFWRISTNDEELLNQTSVELEKFIEGLPGSYGIENTARRIQPQLGIFFKYDVMYRLGVNPAAVASTVQIGYSGATISNEIPHIEDPIRIRVTLAEPYQRSQDELLKLLIPARKRQVKLSQVASIRTQDVPTAYYHINGRKALSVTAYVDKTLSTPLAADLAIRTKFLPKYAHLQNLWIDQAGAGEDMTNAFSGASKASVLGIVGIFVILIITLNSVWQAVYLVLVIPFSLIGVVFGFYFHGQPLGFFAIIGILGLAGVVVNHAVVLVDIINARSQTRPDEAQGDNIKYRNFLVVACETRFRPIILTTLSTVVGLIPAIYGLGGSNDMIRPLGIALADGLLFGTIVTVYLTPCLYHIDRDARRFFNKFKKKKIKA